jgi:hypothetical protein
MLADEDFVSSPNFLNWIAPKSSRRKSAMKVSIHELGGLQEAAQ